MKKISRRSFLKIAGVAAAAGALSACGAASSAASSAAASASSAAAPASSAAQELSGTVRMWTFLDPTNTKNGRSVALQQMITDFQTENPKVTVTVEPQDYATMTAKFLAATATKDAPDIIWCARDELCGVLDANALEPLENLFIGAYSSDELSDIKDAYYDFGERDGKHYTLCLSKNTVVLYYRKDLFDAAGLQAPTSWDEVMDSAKKLTGKDAGTGIDRYGLGQSFSTESSDSQLIANYIIGKQGGLFNEDGTANWANDAGAEAMEWTLNTIQEGVTPKESTNTTNEDLITDFEAGKYAMIVCGAVRTAAVKGAVSFDANAVQIATIPGDSSILDGWFAGVWSGSQNKEAAGRFLEKMYSPEADKLWVEKGGQAPVRKSTLQSITLDDTNQYLQVMLDAFDAGWLPSNKMAFTGWKFDLNQAVQDVVDKGYDSAKALQETAESFNSANGR